MSIAIFSKNQASIIGVPVDVRTGEFHNKTATPSRYATESGDAVSNHIVLDPESVEISAEVSNYDQPGSVQGERAKVVLQNLEASMNARKRYEVLTKHKLYRDMAFIGLTSENTGPFNGRLILRAKFQQMPVGRLSIIQVPASQLPADDGRATNKTASSEIDDGRQEPVTEENDNRSIAAKVADRLSRGEDASNTP